MKALVAFGTNYRPTAQRASAIAEQKTGEDCTNPYNFQYWEVLRGWARTL